jgi:hypothetical protein
MTLRKEVSVMKKGNAALLAVVLVAAVGAFMLVTKVGMTAQVVNEGYSVTTGPFCGEPCRNANDCAGSCGQCSEFTRTCIGTADFRRQSSFAERAMSDNAICNRGCDNAYGKCQSRNPSKPPAECYPSFKACAAACAVDYENDLAAVR